MIHWLTQSTEAHPALAQGAPPDGLLSASEQDRFAALKSEKRRRDWLLGRWTAKRLVQDVLRQQGVEEQLRNLIIGNWASGEPYIQLPQYPVTQSPLSLSISHSHGHAFCAVWEAANWALGADMERITPRSDTFVRDYFTAEEIACLENRQLTIVNCQLSTGNDSRNTALGKRDTAYGIRDTWVTAVWSAKEAALKALRLGLSVDTRAVSCLIQPVAIPPTQWTPFGIALDPQRLGATPPYLTGWWRVMEPFVLTLVTQQT